MVFMKNEDWFEFEKTECILTIVHFLEISKYDFLFGRKSNPFHTWIIALTQILLS